MDIELSSRSPDHGLGSWHPAMRPDSQEVNHLDERQEQQPAQQPFKLQKDTSLPASQLDHHSLSSEPPAFVISDQSIPLESPHVSLNQSRSPRSSTAELFVDTERNYGDGKLGSADNHVSFGATLENSAFENISSLSHNHYSDQVDDIRFPEYSSSVDDQVHNIVSTEGLDHGNSEQSDISWDTNQQHVISRTNSFPNVPPLHQANSLLHHQLSRSQAEAIMEEDQNDENFGNGITNHRLSKLDRDEAIPQQFFDENEDTSFFTNSSAIQGSNLLSLADEEARFQEGLPLMLSKPLDYQPEETLHQAIEEMPGSPKWFNDDDDAFSKELTTSSQDSSFFKPQALDRKTTTQVLDSLQHQPTSTIDDGRDHTINQSSYTELVDEASRANTSDVNLQPLAEKEALDIASNAGSAVPAKNPEEEDLAAMWQAALGDDELLDDNDTSLDPPNFFADDGEGFLEESVNQIPNEGSFEPQFSSGPHIDYGTAIAPNYDNTNINFVDQSRLSQGKYQPNAAQLQKGVSSDYFAPQDAPQSTIHPPPNIPNPFTGVSANALNTRPKMPAMAQSFSDKSKGGYTSPYDLPMDVVRHKKRNHPQQLQRASDIGSSSHPEPPPPPRSSSMYGVGAPVMAEPHPPKPNITRGNTTIPDFNPRADPRTSTNAAASVVTSQRGVGSFFEELPSTKPRPTSSKGKPIPGLVQQNQNGQIPFQNTPPQQVPLSQGSAPNSATYQLLPPERMGLYANVPQQDATRQVHVTNSRYSPAPVPQQSAPPARNRYTSSPSGIARPSPPTQSMSFQPRTSSPLAQNSASQHYQRNSAGDIPRDPNHQHGQPVSVPSNHIDQQHQANIGLSKNQGSNSQSVTGTNRLSDSLSDPLNFRQPPPSLPEPRYAPNGISPLKPSYPPQNLGKDYAPPNHIPHNDNFVPHSIQNQTIIPSKETYFRPPQRSQTQSPGAVRSKYGIPPNVQEPLQRPASVNHQSTPSYTNSSYSVAPNQAGPQSRGLSQRFSYIAPTDGSELDPLERWKGCPIFSFGFGGTVVTSFPKQIPRYSAGQSTPMLKCSPGEVRISIGKIVPLEEGIVTFPGPLKSKSKKKEVLDWLQKRVVHLETSQIHLLRGSALPSSHKHLEEKILLSKTLQILVEHDGLIEGNSVATSAARSLLLPGSVPGDAEHVSSHNPDRDLLGISKHSESKKVVEPLNPEALEVLRKLLLQGEREKAVWYAVDQRLWDHAMLLSSTLESKLWKQVLQEFIRQEVKTFGRNTESLASLYQIFAGNWEESIDELVPPSARAGLQMVSKNSAAAPAKNALDGLERWRETLTLILSNRSQNDSKALVTLGRLLSNYGRTEAAHVCYIFAKTPGLFAGADDPHAGVVLFGADHIRFPFDYSRDFDSILLTEIYDFATTVLASSAIPTVSPHLQSYKLYHATLLAENGHRLEAQQYCEAITTALKSTTKLSPYYHSLLFGALEDLIERLRQAPKDGSASWMSKPSMDKVSGSVWAKFNQFIAGDESDNGSAVSGKGHDQDGAGPFARVSGDSPSISRMPSSNELYNSYPFNSENTGVPIATNSSTSRYAPTGQYASRSSLEQARSSSLQEPRRQSDGDSLRPVLPHQQYQSRNNFALEMSQESPPNSYKQSPQPLANSPQSQSYLPTPPSQPEYMPVIPQDEAPSSLHEDSYRPTPPPKDEPVHQSLPPLNEHQPSDGYDPPHFDSNPSSSYEPPHSEYNSAGYEPPTYSYEPPSYNPDVTDDAESPIQEKPKKKSFMNDDDEDFEAREAAARKEEKAKKDRDVDEAVRKAAEADGMYICSCPTLLRI